MASGPTKGAVTDWQPVQASDWQDVNNAAAPDNRNAIQRAFDNLTTVTPEQERGHSAPVNALQKVGAGVMQIATPFVHPLNALENAQDALIHPGDTLNETIQGAKAHPWETVGNVLGGAVVGGAAGEAARPILDRIPTRAKAGKIFNSLNTDLANQPVKLSATTQPLQRVIEIGERGGTLPAPVSKFLQRSQSPIDMTFPEARDYQSNLSSLSREDQGGMTGPMRGGVGQLNKAFFEDIKNAAGPRGEDYAKAMKMNRQASQLNHAFKTAGKYGAGALGLGAADRFIRESMR